MSWHTAPMLAFDLETTGKDVETARIVTASVVHIDPRNGRDGIHTRTWLVDPGIDIPAEATDVHGITTAHAQEHGTKPSVAVYEIEQALQSAWVENTPVVIYNAPFDLTVLDRELRRHHGLGIDGIGPIVDPLVIDKTLDRYRKGSRKLTAVCEHHGIVLDQAHTASADALAAARLAWALACRYPDELGDLHALQPLQADWFADNAASFEQFLKRRKTEAEEPQDVIDAIAINRDWPLTPHRDIDMEVAS